MTAAPQHLDLTDAGTLLPILRRHGFATRKRLGQHLLISRKALEAIIAACELQEGLPVLEIGAGIGTLTRALAEQDARVTAIELDTRAVEVLQETVGAFPNVTVLQQDILTVDLPALLDTACWTVVGNLPYYITTPVISRMIEQISHIKRLVFMVQREVAERLYAVPGSKVYGALSVFAQVYAQVERVVRVAPGRIFTPAQRGLHRGASDRAPGAVGAGGPAGAVLSHRPRGLRPTAQNAGKCAGRRRYPGRGAA